MPTSVENKIKGRSKFRLFLGGVLILYLFVLLGLWFFDAYLILKHLPSLPYVLMIATSMLFVLLIWVFRKTPK